MLVFYVSSHGFGHLTRCLAIIDRLLDTCDKEIFIVCGKNQIEFARTYFEKHKNIGYRELTTDIGLINKKESLEIDKEKLEIELEVFIETWDSIVLEEVNYFENKKITLINSDISAIGFLVAEKLGVKSLGISNFTWVDQYKYIGINEKIIGKYIG